MKKKKRKINLKLHYPGKIYLLLLMEKLGLKASQGSDLGEANTSNQFMTL
jgi:hypothetical protein